MADLPAHKLTLLASQPSPSKFFKRDSAAVTVCSSFVTLSVLGWTSGKRILCHVETILLLVFL